MHNYCKTIGALATVSAIVCGTSFSAEVEYELHAGYSSEYLFRGLILGQDLVEAGADVKAEVAGIGLSAGAWCGSFDNSGAANQDVREFDLYGQISKDFGFVTVASGYIYRNFESNETNLDWENPPSQEVYFALSRQFYGIDLSLSYYWGIEGENDGYSECSIGRSFELSRCVALNCGARLGYQIEEGQLSALTTKLSVDWEFVQHAKLSPFVAYAISLCDDVDTWYAGAENQVIGGLMISVAF
jgi:hypothetical protein